MRKLGSIIVTALLCLQLVGCSSGTTTSNDPDNPNPVASATPGVENSTDGENGTAANGTSGSNSGTTTENRPAQKEHKLAMRIDESVDKPYFQNGPSPDEVAAMERRLKKKPKRKKHYSSGHNAPVFDTEMVEVNVNS